MKRTDLIIEPDAKGDIRAAIEFYTDKSQQAADKFLAELERSFDLISLYPEATAVAFGSTRLKPTRRFPYVIGYIFHDGVVHVTGVQHGGLGWVNFESRDF